MTDRAEYIAGLRVLADLLDADPDLRLPFTGDTISPITVFARSVETALAYLRAMDVPPEFKAGQGSDSYAGSWSGRVKGLRVRVYVDRSVCEERTVESAEYVIPDALFAAARGEDGGEA